MRVHLKGIHRVRSKLADGTVQEYFYAWRGGPRLVGQPGSPEFIDSYQAAHRNRREPNRSELAGLIAAYKASPEFMGLSERTRHDYLRQIGKIEEAFGDLPLEALEDRRVTSVFLEWRDTMRSSPRQADYAWTVLMRILSWARGRGLITFRPPERVQKLYRADRSERIWTPRKIEAFMAVAPASLQRALVLALETGQRQGDLLLLPWSAYDGQWIRLRQSKAGRKVAVPVTHRLRVLLDGTERLSTVILTASHGRPWSPNGFRSAWHKASRKANIRDLTFHDLRGTAVTRLAEAGCTHAEIAAITGHSMRGVGGILDRYTARTPEIAIAAIAKLERGER